MTKRACKNRHRNPSFNIFSPHIPCSDISCSDIPFSDIPEKCYCDKT